VYTPDPVSWSGPAPEAVLHRDELIITWHEPAEAVATELRTWFKSQVDAVTGFLNQLQINIDDFNAKLPGLARDLVADRRSRHEHAHGVAKALGYSLKRRSDASDFEIPVRRRVLAPQRQPQATLLRLLSTGSAKPSMRRLWRC
jgi:phytoene dehydrogenase-like protein